MRERGKEEMDKIGDRIKNFFIHTDEDTGLKTASEIEDDYFKIKINITLNKSLEKKNRDQIIPAIWSDLELRGLHLVDFIVAPITEVVDLTLGICSLPVALVASIFFSFPLSLSKKKKHSKAYKVLKHINQFTAKRLHNDFLSKVYKSAISTIITPYAFHMNYEGMINDGIITDRVQHRLQYWAESANDGV